MSILYNAEQRAIADQAERVLRARTGQPRLLGLLETTGEFDQGFWETAVGQGWPAIAIPEVHGGIGLGLVELGIVAEACGAQTSGAPFLAHGHAAARGLIASGNAELIDRWLPALAAGTARGAIAFSEGTEALPPVPSVWFGNGVLTGTKRGVAGGLAGDFAIVWATDEQGPVLVCADLAGVNRLAVPSYDNGRLFADLTFAGTSAAVLGRGAAARDLALDLLARLATILAHEQVGGARAAMLKARDYALERKAFGQPIGAFQSVKHRIAEMYCLVEIARANAIHAAAVAEEGGERFVVAAADARISATECYDGCARDAMQVHGASGVTWDLGLHLHVRRARSLAIEAGSLYFWEDVLAARLAGGAA